MSVSAFASSAYAEENDLTRIFYYRDGAVARQSLFAHYKHIDILAPQIYAINSDGELENELVNDEALVFARAQKLKVMPLVTNKKFSQAALAILDSPEMQDKVLVALIDEAKKNGYIGYQLDFEQMNLSYKDKYSAFVSKLHQGLSKEGFTLSVAVVAKISDNPNDYKNTLWQDLIGAYDYDALAKSADFVSVMSYDDPDSKGPIARKLWLEKVIGYSVERIPKEKISLGIGLYYWVWSNTTEKLVGIGGYEGMKNVMKKYDPTYIWSTIQHAPYLTYVKAKKRYTMWYENGRSVAEKISLIKKYDLHGFSAWALGLEVPSVFNAI